MLSLPISVVGLGELAVVVKGEVATLAKSREASIFSARNSASRPTPSKRPDPQVDCQTWPTKYRPGLLVMPRQCLGWPRASKTGTSIQRSSRAKPVAQITVVIFAASRSSPRHGSPGSHTGVYLASAGATIDRKSVV